MHTDVFAQPWPMPPSRRLLAIDDPAAWVDRRARRIALAHKLPRAEAAMAAIQDWARFVPQEKRMEVWHAAQFNVL